MVVEFWQHFKFTEFDRFKIFVFYHHLLNIFPQCSSIIWHICPPVNRFEYHHKPQLLFYLLPPPSPSQFYPLPLSLSAKQNNFLCLACLNNSNFCYFSLFVWTDQLFVCLMFINIFELKSGFVTGKMWGDVSNIICTFTMLNNIKF